MPLRMFFNWDMLLVLILTMNCLWCRIVVQFTVKHEQGIDCGGGYVKVRLGSSSGHVGHRVYAGERMCCNVVRLGF